MKKSILAISLLSSLVILSTGCGSSSDSKSKTIYDLSQYSLPAQSQISNYIVKTYENDKGKKKYSDMPDEENTYTQKYDVNGTTIKEYSDDTLIITHTIQADKIIEDDEDEGSKDIVRQAKEGDVTFTINETLQEDGITMNMKSSCKVGDHLDSKKVIGTTYNDVLEIVCKGTLTSPTGAKLNGLSYSAINQTNTTIYFAKDKGMIMEICENCYKVTVNGADVKNECEKEISELVNIN